MCLGSVVCKPFWPEILQRTILCLLVTKSGNVYVLFIYLPHIINYTITITQRYKNVDSNGEEA